jgi:FixJ family two-component response regulator
MNAQIYLVDDDPGALRSLAFLLERHRFAVHAFSCPREFLALESFAEPACLITDFRMPQMTGLELFRQLEARGTPLATVIVTAFGEIATCSAALRSGVVEYLEKPVAEEALLEAVRLMLECSDRRLQAMALKLRCLCEEGSLTQREGDVLRLVVQGHTLKQIAREFGTTIQTVSKQRLRVYEKLGVNSNVELLHRLLPLAG